MASDPQGHGIIAIQDGDASARNGFRNDRLHSGQILNRIDVIEPEMVTSDIEHATDVAPIESQSLPQYAAPRGFQYGRIDGWIGEHHPRADRPACVTP